MEKNQILHFLDNPVKMKNLHLYGKNGTGIKKIQGAVLVQFTLQKNNFWHKRAFRFYNKCLKYPYPLSFWQFFSIFQSITNF